MDTKQKKRRRLRRRFVPVLCISAVLSAIFFLIFLYLGKIPDSQYAAERWRGENDTRFAQVSWFAGSGDTLSPGQISAFRRNLSDRLLQEAETSEEDVLFTDAWSLGIQVSVTGEHGSADTAGFAVGGNFFFFHPLRLVSGSYLTESDVNSDRVLLDRELAWRLFGGTDLEGLSVTVNGTPMVVAGVVEREQDFATEKAVGEGMCLYMGTRAYQQLAANEENVRLIDCYELVCMQPVDSYAENLLSELFPVGQGTVLTNTGRFRISPILEMLRGFGERSMRKDALVLPYWENAARCLEDWCALFAALAIAFGLCPCVVVFVFVMVLLVRLKDRLTVLLPQLLDQAVERSRRRRNYKFEQERRIS